MAITVNELQHRKSQAIIEQIKNKGTKQCKQCSKTKTIDNFSPSTTSKTGYASYCKPCSVEKQRAIYQKYPDRKKAMQRKAYLKRVWGLTTKEYDNLLKSQNGGCAICGSLERLAIDHCHESQKIRGILCHKCNRGIGLFKDNPNLLQKAAQYLVVNDKL